MALAQGIMAGGWLDVTRAFARAVSSRLVSSPDLRTYSAGLPKTDFKMSKLILGVHPCIQPSFTRKCLVTFSVPYVKKKISWQIILEHRNSSFLRMPQWYIFLQTLCEQKISGRIPRNFTKLLGHTEQLSKVFSKMGVSPPISQTITSSPTQLVDSKERSWTQWTLEALFF